MIYVEAKSLSGHGTIVASGGDGGNNNGGAGGRVEVKTDTSLDHFTGTIEAYGGFMDSSLTTK